MYKCVDCYSFRYWHVNHLSTFYPNKFSLQSIKKYFILNALGSRIQIFICHTSYIFYNIYYNNHFHRKSQSVISHGSRSHIGVLRIVGALGYGGLVPGDAEPRGLLQTLQDGFLADRRQEDEEALRWESDDRSFNVSKGKNSTYLNPGCNI